MAGSTIITATTRDKIGKANRRLREANQIPAVIYGMGREPLPLAVDRHEFELFAAHHAASATIVDLKIEGETKPLSAMIREVQHSAVKGTILHVDFIEISMDVAVHAPVAVHLLNDPAGVRAGGVLTINLHEITVEAKPADLPQSIDADVAELEIGDSLHVKDLVLPQGVTVLEDAEAVIASVQAPRVEVEEVVEEEAEPEIVGGKGEAEEE